jgi:hypothetical protein
VSKIQIAGMRVKNLTGNSRWLFGRNCRKQLLIPAKSTLTHRFEKIYGAKPEIAEF